MYVDKLKLTLTAKLTSNLSHWGEEVFSDFKVIWEEGKDTDYLPSVLSVQVSLGAITSKVNEQMFVCLFLRVELYNATSFETNFQ